MGRLPNLVIAGVNKAGTTSLFSYLSRHPDIGVSHVKETCYFLPLRYGEPMAPLREYAAYFKNCVDQRYVLESTPGYLYGGPTLVRALAANLPDVRVIVVLREPVERLISFFKFKQSMLELDADGSLADYVSACEALDRSALGQREKNPFFGLEGGRYADYLDPWFDTFGERLKVVFFDQLKTDRVRLLTDICHWLELDAAAFPWGDLGVENKTLGFRNRRLHGLCLMLNRGGERFFRAHPRIKNRLRSLYQALNAAPTQVRVHEELRARLQRTYTEPNRRLRTRLLNQGYREFPEWLQHG